MAQSLNCQSKFAQALPGLALAVVCLSASACGASSYLAGKNKKDDGSGGGTPTANGLGSGSAQEPATGSGSGGAATASGSGEASGSSGSGAASGSADDASGEGFVVAALGDSITRGFDAKELLAEDVAGNFATGETAATAGESHLAHFIKDFKLASAKGANVAVTGNFAADLALQLGNLADTPADYATLLIGGNDVCAWQDDYADDLANYKKDVGDTLAALIAANPAVKIVLIPVPDIVQLYEVEKGTANCHQFWNLTGFCPAVLASDATADSRAAFHVRWAAMNAAVQALAKEHPANARFATDVASGRFTAADISAVDCFHPSALGQKTLARFSYDAGFAGQAVTAFKKKSGN